MSRLSTLFIAATMLALATAACAEGVLVDKSDISFVTKQMGVNFEGRFRKWKANIVFFPTNLAKSKAELDIDLTSIDLQSDDSDSEARGPLWFDMAKYPVAHFASTSMKSLGGDKFEIVGPLTIKGVTKNVVVPIALKKDASGNQVAEGTFIVKRLDYGIGLGLWSDTQTVANDVIVKIRMVLPTAA
jgi:polyisoprenoid-binding protein YceI